METSSPLAAIRPAPPTFAQGNLFGPPLGPSPLGPGSMNIFQRQNPEYFNIKAVRGSSPAASLAADLSQNFKLNEASSPMFPTPRRALFTTATMMDGFKSREYLTTPPLAPSSSPGNVDMMDMSPLPQKGSFVSHVEVPSPTPSIPMSDDIMMESPVPQKTFMDPSRAVGAEARRKLSVMRPSLNRAKGYTTGAIPSRSNAVNQFPSFKFGSDVQLGSSPSTSMSLSECFQDSPPQQRRPLSANSPCPAMASNRPKPHFNLAGINGVRNGSPINHARKSSNPSGRPRKALNRRSLSMFESAEEVMKPREPAATSSLHSVPDVEEAQVPILPHFMAEDEQDNIPRISRSTMLEVLDGKYSDQYQHKMIIDCRFEYEYEGGHIDGAINYNDKELLADHLFRTPMEGHTLLIFHCEYSAHRAPLMARHIRAADRQVNQDNYPRLTYPDVYILEGGYSGFFSEHQERCYPQAYVEMDAAGHEKTCEREMGRLKQRRGLGRAQTYAFGDRIQDSPTAPGRRIGRDCEFADLGQSPLGADRGPPRRMVSF
ncbi:putative M-phase inducer phosphatase [Triangularia setosa]|uniref:M-phase inducer phosphatase n=1 Tax=Triangularia setosa TaxID=2587417 RepID=A0AAN7ACL7_9PEZI|nr:putative M-phase inducer phosphatase [Podospora setosa]